MTLSLATAALSAALSLHAVRIVNHAEQDDQAIALQIAKRIQELERQGANARRAAPIAPVQIPRAKPLIEITEPARLYHT